MALEHGAAGRGIIFTFFMVVWAVMMAMQAHWSYLIIVTAILRGAYVWFMKAHYHLHEEYLAGLKKE